MLKHGDFWASTQDANSSTAANAISDEVALPYVSQLVQAYNLQSRLNTCL